MAITTITNAMVSVNAIQGTLIADNAITAVHIATNAVSGTLIADNAVTATHIAQNVITVTQLADDCVESDKIADGVITTNHLNKAMISSQTEVTPVAGDFVLIGDTSDSNNLKKVLVSGITSLATISGISSSADATAITIGSDEVVTFSKPTTSDGHTSSVATIFEANGNGDTVPVQLKVKANNGTTSTQGLYGNAGSASTDNTIVLGNSGTSGVLVNSSGNVGIGTQSPSSKLHLESGSAHNKLSITSTANGGTGYDAVIDLLGSASNSEVQLNMGINGDADREQIKTYQSVMSFRANNKNGIQLDGVSSNSNTEGNLRQHYSTDSGSNKRYTATLNPRIAEVGLQGYWDPTKPTPYSGNTVYDFSPSTHGNGNQDLTKESGVTHVVNSNRAVWQFDGTGNAGMYGNPNLAAGKSASFSLWIYWNNVNSLSSSYQLNGIQIGNHYMYIGIVQGANDSAPLYGYAGQGTNIPPSSANNYEQAYVNSDEWVYLTIQFGHGSSDVTSRTKGRAEVYLNGSLVQRRDNIALPTVAANGSSSFLLGRVQGGYYLDGYIGPAVLYERTLHQWEILENMRVHADMYMS